MKQRFFYCFLGLLLMLVSCTNETYLKADNLVLPKKLKIIFPTSSTTNISYEGSKIWSISDEKSKTYYEYEGNHIAKETSYIGDAVKETKYYDYENDLLKTVIVKSENKETKYIYNYNSDGTITKETYDLDSKTQKEVKDPGKTVYTIAEGNLMKLISDWGYRDVTTASRYEYDTKNNAFKNVLGFNLLLDQDEFGAEFNISSPNNLTRYTFFPIRSEGIVFEPYSNTFIYEYNKKGYPIKKTTFDYAERIIEIMEYSY